MRVLRSTPAAHAGPPLWFGDTSRTAGADGAPPEIETPKPRLPGNGVPMDRAGTPLAPAHPGASIERFLKIRTDPSGWRTGTGRGIGPLCDNRFANESTIDADEFAMSWWRREWRAVNGGP